MLLKMIPSVCIYTLNISSLIGPCVKNTLTPRRPIDTSSFLQLLLLSRGLNIKINDSRQSSSTLSRNINPPSLIYPHLAASACNLVMSLALRKNRQKKTSDADDTRKMNYVVKISLCWGTFDPSAIRTEYFKTVCSYMPRLQIF